MLARVFICCKTITDDAIRCTVCLSVSRCLSSLSLSSLSLSLFLSLSGMSWYMHYHEWPFWTAVHIKPMSALSGK